MLPAATALLLACLLLALPILCPSYPAAKATSSSSSSSSDHDDDESVTEVLSDLLDFLQTTTDERDGTAGQSEGSVKRLCRPIKAVEPFLNSSETVEVTLDLDAYVFRGLLPEPFAALGDDAFRGGTVLIGEPHIDYRSYAPLAHRMTARGVEIRGGVPVGPTLIILPPCTPCLDRQSYKKAPLPCQACAGLIVELLNRYELDTWALIGVGEGALAASIFAETHHPRVKGLSLIAGYPDKSVDLVAKNILVQVFAGDDDEVYPAREIAKRLDGLPLETLFESFANTTHEDFSWSEVPCDPEERDVPLLLAKDKAEFAPNARLATRDNITHTMILGTFSTTFYHNIVALEFAEASLMIHENLAVEYDSFPHSRLVDPAPAEGDASVSPECILYCPGPKIWVAGLSAMIFGLYYAEVTVPGRDWLNDESSLNEGDGVTTRFDEEFSWWVYEGPKPYKAGLIFFIGAHVPPEAYAVLLRRVARLGYFIVSPYHPILLSPLNANEAGTIVLKELGETVDDWFAVGHSAGGVSVGDFCEANTALAIPGAEPPRLLGGIILSGVFGFSNFTQLAEDGDKGAEALRFLTVVGTRDFANVLQPEDPDRVVSRIEASMKTVIPEGNLRDEYITDGTHYQFGAYGYQPPFKTERICDADQQQQGVELMDSFMTDVLAERAN